MTDKPLAYTPIPRDKLVTSPVAYFEDACTIVAQVRGHVDKLFAKVGDQVDKFTPLLGIVHAGEAAGVQDTVTAPCCGVVVSLFENGRGFTKGETLVILVPLVKREIDALPYVEDISFTSADKETKEPYALQGGSRVVINARVDVATDGWVNALVEQLQIPGAKGAVYDAAVQALMRLPDDEQRALVEEMKRQAKGAGHG